MIILFIFPKWAEAGLWGLVSGAALVMGALFAYYTNVSAKITAAIMSFGSGVLISALAFNLMDEAYGRGGFDASVIGFISGSVIYSIGNWMVSRHGGKHRKRSGSKQAKENEKPGSGLAIALGALIRWNS